MKAVLKEFEVDSLEELQEEIDEKQASLEKLADKPKKLADAKGELTRLRTGLQRLQALQLEAAKQSVPVASSMGSGEASAVEPVVNDEEVLAQLKAEMQAKLTKLEEGSIEELAQAIEDKRAEVVKFNDKPKKLAKAQTELKELESGIVEIREIQRKIDACLASKLQQSLPATQVDIEVLRHKQQDLLEGLELDSFEELQDDIQAIKSALPKLTGKPKKLEEAQADLLELETCLDEWQKIQQEIDAQNNDLASVVPDSIESKAVHSVSQAKPAAGHIAGFVEESPKATENF